MYVTLQSSKSYASSNIAKCQLICLFVSLFVCVFYTPGDADASENLNQNLVSLKIWTLLLMLNPIQGGGGQKHLGSKFSSNYFRKAAINDYFDGL